ncbi:translation elongation factor 4 [Candidatus Clavichlamydia salmonicola]|uniref:translation elongation factor 4 n=1 Tax=Candidatus Clavichlamydia salmonicola TaxID=469812 RepID=UPI001891A75D|nr:translation elongation factor 4 [Candidatus Clavichlamydia salmonicola]
MKNSRIKLIRNFSIIAHIDHGKSTLADRLLELTHTVEKREMKEQVLDAMDLERERGITIKAHPVTMEYEYKGEMYCINLIDTPGHVDFSYEVSRSLSACEGALLVLDASQGIQAQSLANVYLALERDLEIIPVMNKIDLPTAVPEEIKKQVRDFIGLSTEHTVCCSAKTGLGVDQILDKIIEVIPHPKEPTDDILRALIFDSHYDSYRGVMVYVRIISGYIKSGLRIQLMAADKIFEVNEVGIFKPSAQVCSELAPGEIGYFIANIKNAQDVKIGETVTAIKHPAKEPLPGFKEIRPVVFAGIYPVDSSGFEVLREALYRLQINDAALSVEQESSHSLGFGFRCGFLGLLHLEIIFERLIREFDVEIITTSPGVVYKLLLRNGKEVLIDNPTHFPDPSLIDRLEEPWVKAHIITPGEFLGAVMNLGMEKRGLYIKTETMDQVRLLLTYEFPLNEIVTDFNDKLKSVTKGYASFDYEFFTYRKGDIVKVDILVNEVNVDAFSLLVHKDKAENKGRALCKKLAEIIPQQLFKVPIQAAINKKVLARETIRALAKNVTAKCYGGDITRKRKLWEKQKKGKKRMKEFGKVSIPHHVFIDILKIDDD